MRDAQKHAQRAMALLSPMLAVQRAMILRAARRAYARATRAARMSADYFAFRFISVIPTVIPITLEPPFFSR